MINRWLFADGEPARLAAVRFGLCATLALRLTRHLYVDLSEQPKALFRPISFMKIFHQMPPRGVVLAVQVLGIAAAVIAAIGLKSRVSLPVAWLCGVFLNGMATSIGKVVHNDVMLLLAMVPLLVMAQSKRPGDAGWPVRVAMIVVAGAYFFSGWQKIVNSGPGWVTAGNLRWVLYTSSDGQAHSNGWALALADRAWMTHLVALATIVVETGFPLVLWKPRLAWLFVSSAVALHVGILLAMRLDYSAQIATAVIVFVNWPAALRWVRRRRVTVTA